jgi:hypothetical protein
VIEMKKLLLGTAAFATLALFSSVASAQSVGSILAGVATYNPTPGGNNFSPLNPTNGVGLVPVATDVIGAFGAGVGSGFGFGISASFGIATGNTGSATFTQGISNGSNAQTLGTAAAQSIGLGGASGTGNSEGFGFGKGTGGADINTTLGVNNGIAATGGSNLPSNVQIATACPGGGAPGCIGVVGSEPGIAGGQSSSNNTGFGNNVAVVGGAGGGLGVPISSANAQGTGFGGGKGGGTTASSALGGGQTQTTSAAATQGTGIATDGSGAHASGIGTGLDISAGFGTGAGAGAGFGIGGNTQITTILTTPTTVPGG